MDDRNAVAEDLRHEYEDLADVIDALVEPCPERERALSLLMESLICARRAALAQD